MDLGRPILKFMKNNSPTRKEVLKEFGISIGEFNEVLKTIKSFDHEIVYTNKHYGVSKTFKKEEDVLIINDGNLEPIELYLSDTHSSDNGCNHKLITGVIDEAYDRGVRNVFHSGDWVAGRNVYPGQVHDLRDLTFDQQIERMVNTLPSKKDLRYYGINGNHDLNWLKNNAGNVCKAIADKRDDVIFLGDGYGRVIKNGIKIDLVHLDGGCPYAESYKPQVYLRNYLQNHAEDKPNILSAGHLHKMLWMTHYGIECLLPGHFQNSNTFTKRKGLDGPQGSYLIDYKIDKRKVKNFRAEKLRD